MDNQLTAPALAFADSNPTKQMTMTYVVSLSIIAGLSIIVHHMLDRIVEQQAHTANVVNISGQQRMLSQRVSFFTLKYLLTRNNRSKKLAQQALFKMQENHQHLLDGHINALNAGLTSPFSNTMSELYFSPPHRVNNKIIEFQQLITNTLADRLKLSADGLNDVNLLFLELAEEPLLLSLERVVEQYEIESIEKINQLRLAQQIVFWFIMLTLVAEAIFIFRPMVNKVSKFAEHLQDEANHDHLTGLLNRRAFSVLVEKTLALSKRYQYSLSVATFDIDYFKTVNDTHGHDVGDKVIQHISHIIKTNTRLSDAVARFGGEEFVVLLPQTKQHDALTLTDKIREVISTTPFVSGQISIQITVSGGVSQYQVQDNTLNDVLKRADNGLYRAKQSGRNKIYQV